MTATVGAGRTTAPTAIPRVVPPLNVPAMQPSFSRSHLCPDMPRRTLRGGKAHCGFPPDEQVTPPLRNRLEDEALATVVAHVTPGYVFFSCLGPEQKFADSSLTIAPNPLNSKLWESVVP